MNICEHPFVFHIFDYMMSHDIQELIFDSIREQLPDHLSLVDEISDLLEISTDSAYRRMRGETFLTIQEVALLADHFGFSLDALIQPQSEIIPFNYQPIQEDGFTFRNYLERVLNIMELVSKYSEHSVVYLANDIPLFHLMHSPEIASFKLLFWEKTILNYSNLSDKKFALKEIDHNVNSISRKLRDLYCTIESTEVYSSESIDATLKQIEYYWVSGHFESHNDALILCDKLEELVKHIKLMAEHGYKFPFQKDQGVPDEVRDGSYTSNYKLYFNEVVHTDNTVLIHAGDQYRTYLTNNGINSFHTTSRTFYDDTLNGVKILLRKASLISGTAEKERNRIFNNYLKKIQKLRNNIEN